MFRLFLTLHHQLRRLSPISMSGAPFSALPPEITEIVIHKLACRDPDLSSIKACSLVCSEFLHTCRKYIFACIALNDENAEFCPPYCGMGSRTKATTVMLQRLLETSPEIGGCIRHLDYRISADDLKIASLLETFKNITRLKYLRFYTRDHLLWNHIPFRPMLLHLLHLPTLLHLNLNCIRNFIVTDLTHCVNLEHLEIEGITLYESSTSPTVSHLPKIPVRCRKLSISAISTATITKICSVPCADRKPFIDFSRITFLSAHVFDPTGVEPTRYIFSQCDQLRTVSIHVSCFKSFFPRTGLFDLLDPSIQTLKRLSIHAEYLSSPLSGPISDDLIRDLPQQLEQIESKNIIEDICFASLFTNEMDFTRRSEEWGQLDEVLVQSKVWPNLRRVGATLVVLGSNKDKDYLDKTVKGKFPNLLSNKTLHSDFMII